LSLRPSWKRRISLAALAFFLAAGTAGCSSSPKRTTPELSKLEGKKIALVDLEGEPTARKIVEVALVNQLVQRGTFFLVPKEEVEAARAEASHDPTDWKGLARRVNADFALRAKVLTFEAKTREGYSSEEVEDSQLEAERGEKDNKLVRLYKVKAMTGNVRVQLEFSGVGKDIDPDPRTGVAEESHEVTAEARTGAAHLPPKLRFLENLANDAFRKFFDQYND